MKRLLTAVILALFAMTLIACGFSAPSGGNGDSGSAANNGAVAPEPVEDTTPAAGTLMPDPAKIAYDDACALFAEGKYYSAKVAFENSGYGDWEERAAACIQPMPANGELWHSDSLKSDEMQLVLTVESEDSDTGRYFAVYTDKKELAETLFIKGAGSVETWLPGGNYYIKDAFGTEWYGEKELFGPDGHYETMVFDEVDGDRYLTVLDEGYVWEISINTSSHTGQSVDSEETSWEDWS